jgi:DNA-binding PadR family transcriptional regulator
VAELTTTSYAILALLAVRPWTTYDLAKQMERSLRDVWPRAESVVYEEPKKLVAKGLAKAEKQYAGKRPRTEYSITPKGRRALRRWFGEEATARPVIEFEAMLKVAFGDFGTRAQLLATIRSIHAASDERVAYVRERIREYDETGGPFPERLPVIRLLARFQLEEAETRRRWAKWAEAEVKGWRGP